MSKVAKMLIPTDYPDTAVSAQKKIFKRTILKWFMVGILIRLTFMPFTMHGDLIDYIRAGYHIAYEGHYTDVYQYERKLYHEKGALIRTLYSLNENSDTHKYGLLDSASREIDLKAGGEGTTEYYALLDSLQCDGRNKKTSFLLYAPDGSNSYGRNVIRLDRTRTDDSDNDFLEITEIDDGRIISKNFALISKNAKNILVDIKNVHSQQLARISFYYYGIEGSTLLPGPYVWRWGSKGRPEKNKIRFQVMPSDCPNKFQLIKLNRHDIDYELNIAEKEHNTNDSTIPMLNIKAYSVLFPMSSKNAGTSEYLWLYSPNKQGDYENNAIRFERINLGEKFDLLELVEFENGRQISKNSVFIDKAVVKLRIDIAVSPIEKQSNISFYYYQEDTPVVMPGPFQWSFQKGSKIHFAEAVSDGRSSHLKNFKIEEVGPVQTGNISGSSYPPMVYFFSAATLTLFKPLMLINDYVKHIQISGSWLAWFSYANVNRNIFLIKLPFLFFDMALAFLLLKIVDTGEKGLSAFKLWMLNPFSIYSSFIHGQYDILPAFFVILALYFARQKKWYYMCFAIGLGTAIKSWPILLLLPSVIIIEANLYKRIKLFFCGVAPYVATLIPYQIANLHSIAAKQTMAAQINNRLTEFRLFVGMSEFTAGVEDFIYVFFFLYSLVLINIFICRDSIFKDGYKAFLRYWAIIMAIFFSTIFFHPQWYLWITPLFVLIFAEYKELKGSALMFFMFLGWVTYNAMFGRPSEAGLFFPLSLKFAAIPSLKEVVPHMMGIAHSGRSFMTAIMVYISFYAAFERYFTKNQPNASPWPAFLTPRAAVLILWAVIAMFLGLIIIAAKNTGKFSAKAPLAVREFLSRVHDDPTFFIIYGLIYISIFLILLRGDKLLKHQKDKAE